MGQAHRVGDAEKGHVVFLEPFRDRTKKPGMQASGDRTDEGVEFRVVHRTIWVIDLHDFWVLQNELVSDRSSSRKWTHQMLRAAHAYAKYIDCMRVRNSRLAGACSGGPVPETFQRPNGKSTAAPAVEQFTLRIPAFARWRKSSINCVKLEKTAAASLCFIPLQSAIACSLAVVVLPPIAAKISPELRKITEDR